MYSCVELSNNQCVSWQLDQGLQLLTAAEGAQIGSAALGVMAAAWGVRQLFKLIMTMSRDS